MLALNLQVEFMPLQFSIERRLPMPSFRPFEALGVFSIKRSIDQSEKTIFSS
jgi:hypothetical protein